MNNNLFKSVESQKVDANATRNNAGGVAYKMADKEAFVKLISTLTFRDSAYVAAETQLRTLVELAKKVDDIFLAKAIVYSHEVAKMKDVPAVLTVLLSTRNSELTKTVFRRVADARFVSNIIAAVRCGKLGRRSLGARLAKEIEFWLNNLTPMAFANACVSKNGIKMKDVISLAHPRPNSLTRQVMFGWAMGKMTAEDANQLPSELKALEAWREGSVPESIQELRGMFELLTGHAQTTEQWTYIARQATWNQTIKNLNTFARHGVFNDKQVTELIVNRLINQDLIKKSRAHPTQLLMAYLSVDSAVPTVVKDALVFAVDELISALDVFQGRVLVGLDVSRSMTTTPATGHDSKGNSSKLNCMQASSLFAIATCRQNPAAKMMLFDTKEVRPERYGVNLKDSVLRSAEKLSQILGGGTSCHLVLERALADDVELSAILMFSDNESWHIKPGDRQSRAHDLWKQYKRKYPKTKMVCWDISPNCTKPINEDKDILYVGGFTTEGMEQTTRFLRGTYSIEGTDVKGRTVIETIELIEL
jgi:60 kDa SS-A/Ro ribonucleoprotein